MADTSVADLLGNLSRETTQGAVKTAVQSIDGKTPALVSGRVPVDGSGVTQPVSGTVTATQSGTWAQNLTQIGGAALSLGQKTAANSLSVAGASDGYFVVGGATPDGSAPAAGTYSVRVGGQDSSGNKRTLLLKSGGELPTYSPALTITENFNAALTASYQKVATTTASTKMLRMSAACNATAYDIEFQVVAAGGAAPTTTGMALLAGDDFPLGIPIGDIYARSASLQKLIVWSA